MSEDVIFGRGNAKSGHLYVGNTPWVLKARRMESSRPEGPNAESRGPRLLVIYIWSPIIIWLFSNSLFQPTGLHKPSSSGQITQIKQRRTPTNCNKQIKFNLKIQTSRDRFWKCQFLHSWVTFGLRNFHWNGLILLIPYCRLNFTITYFNWKEQDQPTK